MFTFSHEVQEPSRPVAVCSLEGLLNSMLAGSLEFKPAIWVSCLCQSRSRFGLQTFLELPVWERPPVSVANGLCHPRDWIPGQARDDTVYSLVELVSWEPFHHFTFPPSKILSSAFYHHVITTPPHHHKEPFHPYKTDLIGLYITPGYSWRWRSRWGSSPRGSLWL